MASSLSGGSYTFKSDIDAIRNEKKQIESEGVVVAIFENGDSEGAAEIVKNGVSELDTGPYAGMGKELVLKYSDTPFYRRLRKGLLAVFLLAWLGLLVGVIYLAVTHKECRQQPARQWWQTAQVYQVYPRSFLDSNNDGVGDLEGVRQHLDYLKDLGVDVVWLNSFYKSPMVDLGYDVEDHVAVDPLFGTMSDFDRLLQEAHDKGLKIIVDFIPNHTSNKHKWFLSNDSAYKDFYIRKDCTCNGSYCHVNNWVSVFGGPMWSHDDAHNQCYLHQFWKEQPDLNFRNNRVKQAINEVAQFWLVKGVDGFRVAAAGHLYEDYLHPDEQPASGVLPSHVNAALYNYWNHTYTLNLPEVIDMVSTWRELMNKYEPYRFMATDSFGTPKEVSMYYGRVGSDGADFPFNFQLLLTNDSCDGRCIRQLVDGWLAALPFGKTANWVTGNHDYSRIRTKVGEDLIDAMNMLVLLLPGTSTTYYGEEIGMTDLPSNVLPAVPQDKAGRDAYRSPMQWTSGTHAGFSSNSTRSLWLPVHPNSSDVNVEAQSKLSTSHLNIYKTLSQLRKMKTFQVGDMEHLKDDRCLYAFKRSFDGLPTYVVAINFCHDKVSVNLLNEFTPVDKGRYPVSVAAVTGSLVIGNKDDLSAVSLGRGQGVVFQWDHIIEERI